MRALTPPKLGGYMDTMSRTNTSRKMRKPLPPTDSRGTRETREIVMSRTSPRTLLLHMPLTDLLRRIYRLADSRSGALAAGHWKAPPGGSLTRESREHDNSSPSNRSSSSVLVAPSCLQTIVLVCVVTHSAAVVQSLEHFAHAERSGVITLQRF